MKHHVPLKFGHVDTPGRGELGSTVKAALEAEHVKGFTERIGEARDFSLIGNHDPDDATQSAYSSRSIRQKVKKYGFLVIFYPIFFMHSVHTKRVENSLQLTSNKYGRLKS